MRAIFKSALALAMTLCMLLAVAPSAGALWDFSNGVPADWERPGTLEAVKADYLLQTVNPNASQEAKNLLAYLQIVGSSQQFIAGQFDISTSDNSYKEVVDDYGLEPALYSCRYEVDLTAPTWGSGANSTVITNSAMDFTDVDKTNELLKKHYDNGNILLVHADSAPRELCAAAAMKNKPTEYPDETDAIIELDATNPDRDLQSYALWIKYQSGLIEALKKLEASGVKAYMYRGWVEYANHKFAGRTDAGYDAFVRVYQQTVQMLIDAGLEGFLVAFSPACWTNIVATNPGTEYVDTYTYTIYTDRLGVMQSADLHSDNYQLALRSGKPMGFSEFSCRTGSWTNVTKHARASCFDLLKSTLNNWPEIAWVNFWDGAGYDTGNVNNGKDGNDDGKLFWSSDYAITLDEAIDYRQGIIPLPGIAQVFETGDATDDYVGLEQRDYTAADLAKMGVTAADLRAVRLNSGYAITFWTNEDCTGEYYCYGFSQKNIAADIARDFRSLSVTTLENVAFEKDIWSSVNDNGSWKANDGLPSVWEGNVYAEDNEAEPGTAWIYVDLGKAYHIGRYVLKNASFASRPESYNTADFQMQYSNDCENWTTVDTVTDNALGQVNRYISPVMAQYFRLLITDPNTGVAESDKGVVTVSELELHGVDPGLLSLLLDSGDDKPEEEQPGGSESDTPDEPGEDSGDSDLPGDDTSDEEFVEDEQPEEDDPAAEDTSGEESDDDTPSSKPESDDVTLDEEGGGSDDLPSEDTDQPADDDADADDEDVSTPDEQMSADDDNDETSGNKKKPVQIVTTETYFPWWGFLLIGLGVLAVAAVVIWLVWRRKKRTAAETNL